MANKKINPESLTIKSMKGAFIDYIDVLEKRSASDGSDVSSTGFTELDEKINSGLMPGQLIILAARPGMGKSAYALQILENMAATGKPVLLYTMEMGINEIIERIIIRNTGIPTKSMKTGQLSKDEWAKLAAILPYVQNLPLFVNDYSSHSDESIKIASQKFIEELKAEDTTDTALIAIDYLQLMKSSEKMNNKNEDVGMITRNMKEMARDLNSPVLLLSQLNRSLESRPNKRPQMSDLRDSGSIEQDADIILALYRNDYYHPEKEEFAGIAESIILKNREGPLGTVYSNFDGSRYKFSGMDKNDFLNVAMGAVKNNSNNFSKQKKVHKRIDETLHNMGNEDPF
jgi:replicative DNA helicase